MSTNDYYHSPDISLVATLITLGFTLGGLDKSNPQKVNFIFQKTSKLEKAVNGYWGKSLRCEPQGLLANLKMLKSRIYSDEVMEEKM